MQMAATLNVSAFGITYPEALAHSSGTTVAHTTKRKAAARAAVTDGSIDDVFVSLYTDKTKGILTEQRFMKLTTATETEQETNHSHLKEIQVEIHRSDEQESDVRTFAQGIRQYASIHELDEAILNRLISKIIVGDVKKIDGQKMQEVRIIYNFVGEIHEITV